VLLTVKVGSGEASHQGFIGAQEELCKSVRCFPENKWAFSRKLWYSSWSNFFR